MQKGYYSLIILFILISCTACKQKSNDSENNDSVININSPYSGAYSIEYDEMMESADSWEDTSQSPLEFETLLHVDTVFFANPIQENQFIRFYKLKYPIKGVNQDVLNKINCTIKSICYETTECKKTLNQLTQTLINKTTDKQIKEIQTSTKALELEGTLINDSYRISLNLSPIKSDSSYLAISFDYDTRDASSQAIYLNFNLQTGDLLHIEDVLKTDVEAINSLKIILNKKLKELFNIDTYHYNFNPPTNFYLSNKFLAVMYNFGELTPLYEGSLPLYISYKEIEGILNYDNTFIKDKLEH